MTDQVKIKNPKPLFRRHLRTAPAHALGDRILVREFPVESVTEGGLHIPETAKERYMAGQLLSAGDKAADKLYDLGVEIGDEIWYAKYAGIIQEWQHIVGDDVETCDHDGVWDFVSASESAKWSNVGFKPNENTKLRECRACGTLKVTERVIAMSVDDICVDVDLLERLETGQMRRLRGKDPEGRTRYYIERAHSDALDLAEIDAMPAKQLPAANGEARALPALPATDDERRQ